MASPIVPGDIPVLSSVSPICDRLNALIGLPATMKEFLEWVLNSDGTINQTFITDLLTRIPNLFFGTDTGGVDALSISVANYPHAALQPFLLVTTVAASNSGASATLTINSPAAIPPGAVPVKVGGSNPALGELIAGKTYLFYYDGATAQLLNPTAVAVTPAFTSSFISADIPIGAAGTVGTPIPHGLGAVPKLLYAVLVCQSPDVGIVAAQEVDILHFLWHFVSGDQDSSGPCIRVVPDAINLTPEWAQNASGSDILFKTTSSTSWTAIDTSKWRLRIRAFV